MSKIIIIFNEFTWVEMKCQMTNATVAAAADDDDQIWAQPITLTVIIVWKSWAVRVDVGFLRRTAAEVHRMNFH